MSGLTSVFVDLFTFVTIICALVALVIWLVASAIKDIQGKGKGE